MRFKYYLRFIFLVIYLFHFGENKANNAINTISNFFCCCHSQAIIEKVCDECEANHCCSYTASDFSKNQEEISSPLSYSIFSHKLIAPLVLLNNDNLASIYTIQSVKYYTFQKAYHPFYTNIFSLLSIWRC